MIKYILTLLVIIAPACTLAESVYFGIYTDHAVNGSFNESNKVMLVQSDTGFTAGSMVNSYGRDSVLFGYTQTKDRIFSFGLLFATGYKPENLYLSKYVDSLPLAPLPTMSINIKMSETISLTSNIIGGVVLNTGLKITL